VATSLVPSEAVAKHVAVVSVTGKDFKVDKIRLKSVRPFITKDIVMATDKRFKGLEKKKDNRQEITKKLMDIVDDMIKQATREWIALQEKDVDEESRPLPLIRLKVEYTAPEGGNYECENPQRFSNRFAGRVANVNDVVYFHRKKTATSSCAPSISSSRNDADQMPQGEKRSTAYKLTLPKQLVTTLAWKPLFPSFWPHSPSRSSLNAHSATR
jgi:double-strand break repair protein MRE11